MAPRGHYVELRNFGNIPSALDGGSSTGYAGHSTLMPVCWFPLSIDDGPNILQGKRFGESEVL
jgi:hypothetical protein